MSSISPISLNTAIGNQQTLMDSPLFKSLFRTMRNESITTTVTTPDTSNPQLPDSQVNVQLVPKPLASVTLLTLPKGTRFTAQQIAQLIYKINPQGITLASLKAYPNSNLTPLQQQIRNYFISSPIVFEALAKLDRNKTSLSNEDIRLAAKIVDNLNSNRTTTPAPTPPVQARPTPPINTPTVEPTRPQPPLPQAPLNVPATNQAPATQVPQTTEFTPTGLPLNTPVRPQTPAVQNPDISKNERVRAYAGYNAVPVRRKKRGDDLENTQIVEPVVSEDVEETTETQAPSLSYVKPFFIYKEKIELDANEVKKMFEKIAGKKKILTLFNLRNYEPQNAQEEKVLSILKHLNVYKELSHINHHEDLELEDIEIATDGKDFVFSDGRLDLIIHSSKK